MTIKDVKFENGTLTVPTPKGDIIVTVSSDCSNPGVYIDFASNEIKESAFSSSILEDKPSVQLALIEYQAEEKQVATYVWGNVQNEDFSHKIVHEDLLILNEDNDYFSDGTEIMYDGERAFITGHDEGDFDFSSNHLNYHIAFAENEETYSELCDRLDKEDISYDTMISWHDVVSMEYNLVNTKNYLLSDKFLEELAFKIEDSFSDRSYPVKAFEKLHINEQVRFIFETLCFSYSSVVSQFIQDNEHSFIAYSTSGNVDRYINNVVMNEWKVEPFASRGPVAFMHLLKEVAQRVQSVK